MSLDMRRLGKQRVETLQILKSLSEPEYGWKNHPAVRMWQNHELELLEYGLAICTEWISRGYKDTCFEKISNMRPLFDECDKPAWLGVEELHQSHRGALYSKDPDFYCMWELDSEMAPEYWWPTDHSGEF